MRASRLAEQGRRVAVMDRALSVGGAWATADVLGFRNVEIGVHLLENRPSLYRAIADLDGLNMQRDPCVALLNGRMLPMSSARILFHCGVGANSLRRGAVDRARRSFQSARRAACHVTDSFYYPCGGAARLVAGLAARLRASGGQIHLGEEIHRVDIQHGGVQCHTSTGTVSASMLLASSRALPPLWLQGSRQAPQADQTRVFNAVLHIRSPAGLKSSYVEILGDKHLKRVRDVGRLTDPPPTPGESLLCVQYRDPKRVTREGLGPYLTKHLVRLNLIDPRAEVLGVHTSETRLTTVTDAALTDLERRAASALQLLRTTDFADGFVTAQRNLRGLLSPHDAVI